MTLVRIDIAAHILPARYFGRLQQIPGFYLAKRVKGVRCLFDLTVRFQIMDAFGEYRQVLSLAAPPIDRLGPPEVTPDLARLANDELADLVAAHPDRLAGAFAGLPRDSPRPQEGFADVGVHRPRLPSAARLGEGSWPVVPTHPRRSTRRPGA